MQEINPRRRSATRGLLAACRCCVAALALSGVLLVPVAATAADMTKSRGQGGGGTITPRFENIKPGATSSAPPARTPKRRAARYAPSPRAATPPTEVTSPETTTPPATTPPPAATPPASTHYSPSIGPVTAPAVAPEVPSPPAAPEVPSPPDAPTVPPVAAFSKDAVSSGVGSWILRPAPKSYGPTCGMTDLAGRVLSPDGRELGTSQMIFMTAENFVATTETKGPHARANGVDELVFQRSYTSSSPAPCQGTQQCNTLMSNVSAMSTCYNASKANGIRGFNRGDNLATEAVTYNGYATTWRGASAPKPVIILSMRWDLLLPSEMQVAGFRPSFLLEAAPGAYDAFQNWLTSDTSYYCGAGSDCEWSDSYNGWNSGYRNKDIGFRFKDQIDYFGSPNDYKKYIYYLTRPIGAKPLSADGVLTDMADDDYIAWRIARVKALLAEVNQSNVIVLLNQKLGLRYSGPNGVRNGSFDFSARGRCPSVTDLLWSGQSAVYHASGGIDYTATSPHQSACNLAYTQSSHGNVAGVAQTSGGYTSDTYAAGETYEEYVLSLKNVADALTAAGVPYAWETAGGEFVNPGYWNNTNTTTDEDAVLREITMGASFVWITGSNNDAYLDAVEAAVRGKIPYVRER